MKRMSPIENQVKFSLSPRLSAEAKAFFARNGFVVFRKLFDAGERARILAAVDTVVKQLPPGHPDLQMGAGPDAQPSPGRTYHLVSHSASIRALALEDKRIKCISALCPGGGHLQEGYKSGSHLQDKWPHPDSGFRGLRWHDDWDAPVYGRLLTIAIYFDRSSQANGAMRVVPGTQDIDRAIKLPNETDIHPDEVALVTEPGDVTAHVSGLWHCSPLGWETGVNARRRTLSLTYVEKLPEAAPQEVPAGYRNKVDL